MKQFKLIDDVVLVCVYDEYMLVAARDAVKKVPFLLHINEPAAFYWRMLEQHTPLPVMARTAAKKYNMTGEHAVAAVKQFLNKMYQRGYIQVLDEDNPS